jgi:hypothetical protein
MMVPKTRWVSSSQPSFSRCGQSVSTLYMLLCTARSMIRCTASTTGSEELNVPTWSLPARITRPTASDRVTSALTPRTSK